MAVRLEPEPSPRSPWRNFILTMLANAAGTVLAAIVIYLFGVSVGAIQANRRIIVPILLLLSYGLIFPLEMLWIEFASRLLGGRRLPSMLDSLVASFPLIVSVSILLAFGTAAWEDAGFPSWIFVVGGSALAIFGITVWYRWRRRTERL
jgi:hypothetical protein